MIWLAPIPETIPELDEGEQWRDTMFGVKEDHGFRMFFSTNSDFPRLRSFPASRGPERPASLEESWEGWLP